MKFFAVFFREHNRVARLLLKKFRKWSDEKLYQVARKIVVAQWQNVVFSEFLPIVFGKKAMQR